VHYQAFFAIVDRDSAGHALHGIAQQRFHSRPLRNFRPQLAGAFGYRLLQPFVDLRAMDGGGDLSAKRAEQAQVGLGKRLRLFANKTEHAVPLLAENQRYNSAAAALDPSIGREVREQFLKFCVGSADKLGG
jgi:hypothetical protein